MFNPRQSFIFSISLSFPMNAPRVLNPSAKQSAGVSFVAILVFVLLAFLPLRRFWKAMKITIKAMRTLSQSPPHRLSSHHKHSTIEGRKKQRGSVRSLK
jgi:hypothetical protein